jgi:hypothetical protein
MMIHAMIHAVVVYTADLKPHVLIHPACTHVRSRVKARSHLATPNMEDLLVRALELFLGPCDEQTFLFKKYPAVSHETFLF